MLGCYIDGAGMMNLAGEEVGRVFAGGILIAAMVEGEHPCGGWRVGGGFSGRGETRLDGILTRSNAFCNVTGQ